MISCLIQIEYVRSTFRICKLQILKAVDAVLKHPQPEITHVFSMIWLPLLARSEGLLIVSASKAVY